MHIRSLGLLLFSATLPLSGQEQQPASSHLSGAFRKSGLPDGGEGVMIPLKSTFVGFTVEAMIDGKPVNLILDTGAFMTGISQEAVDRLGLKAEEYDDGVRDIAGAKMVTQRALTKRMSLGGAWTMNEPVLVAKLPGEFGDGALGVSTLADWDVRINPAEKTLKLFPSGKAEALKGETVLRLDSRLVNPEASVSNPQGLRGINLEVPVGLGGHVFLATPDTGYGGTLQVSSVWINKLSPAIMKEASPSLIGGIGASGEWKSRTGKLPEFTFGPDTLRALPAKIVVATPGSRAERVGCVGLNLLRHYIMTFRFSAGELRIKPIGTVQEITSMSTAGINLRPGDGGTVLILSVDPEGPAAKAGIRAGDELLEIEGRPLKTMQPQEFAAFKQLAPGTSVKVRYRRGQGKPVDTTLVLVKE